jgi:putative flippase GtrA
VVGWLAHRRFTFRIAAPPSTKEFMRYAAVQWTAAALNYGIFVLIVLIWPAIEPLIALFVSSGIVMFYSYVGMRFAAFRHPGGSER